MDLAKFDNTAAETGTELVLLNPIDDEPTDMKIMVLGFDSSKAKEAIRASGNKRLKRGKLVSTMEEMEQSGLNLTAACTISWSGIEENGEEVEFAPANVKRIYTEYPWIKEQVDAFIGDRANFLSKS
jgi:hypothetical protein